MPFDSPIPPHSNTAGFRTASPGSYLTSYSIVFSLSVQPCTPFSKVFTPCQAFPGPRAFSGILGIWTPTRAPSPPPLVLGVKPRYAWPRKSSAHLSWTPASSRSDSRSLSGKPLSLFSTPPLGLAAACLSSLGLRGPGLRGNWIFPSPFPRLLNLHSERTAARNSPAGRRGEFSSKAKQWGKS